MSDDKKNLNDPESEESVDVNGDAAEEKVREKAADNSDKKSDKKPAQKKTWWKSMPKWGRGLVIAGISILALALIFWITITIYLSRVKRIEKRDPIDRSSEEFETSSEEQTAVNTIDPDEVDWNNLYENVKQDKQVKNILLIGQDRRPGETEYARSDSIILCSINKNTNNITLVSFMRDMYVPIEGFSDNRINAAYNYGGSELLRKTVENDFGIKIDNCIEVDFEGFIKAMSAVGDLEIELTQAEAEYLNKTGAIMNREAGLSDGEWNLHEGVNSLTPDQALAYARTRHVGRSDWDRTDRQRRVLTVAFEKISKLGIMDQIDVINDILPYVATDMTDMEILGYAYYVATEGIHIGGSLRLPADGLYRNETINKMSVLVPDLKQNSELLKQTLY